MGVGTFLLFTKIINMCSQAASLWPLRMWGSELQVV